MAIYSLRYWYEQVQKDGRIVRLEIHEKEGTAPAMEIGSVVQALHIDIQGQTEDIDAPIVKTSLVMTFVDAPDHEEAATKKCGDWIEFYTPDSTAWKVRLYVSNESGLFDEFWSGFITPDSYSEQLRYRGSVTIIARDNIGHMQDFAFDASDYVDMDMVSLYNLVLIGKEKAGVLMQVNFGPEGQNLECNGTLDIFAKMNISAFEGMNYYDAIERTLYAFGMVMRYIGNNTIIVCPLRYLPFYNNEYLSQVRTCVPVFEAYATRELAPAAKKVEETVSYEIEPVTFPAISQDEFTGQKEGYQVQGNSVDNLGIGWYIRRTNSGYGWCNPKYPLFFNPHAYSFKFESEDKNLTWIGANTYDIDSLFSNTYAEYSRYIIAAPLTINITFGQVYFISTSEQLYASSDQIKSCILYIRAVNINNGQEYYLNQDGTWGTTIAKYKMNISGGVIRLSLGFGENINGFTLFCVRIVQVLTEDGERYPCARYIPIKEASFSQGSSLREKNTVNTIYDERNNVVLTRQPEFGPAYDNVFLPDVIKNGIFVRGEEESEYHPAREWKWADADNDPGSEPMQLAAYNHMQLLCYHSKPNNIISGTIVNSDVTTPAVIYEWRGGKHLLVGGTMNFLTGHIEGATLREFIPYAKMWLPHTDVDYIEVDYMGGEVVIKFYAKDNVWWNVITPVWIEADITLGKGNADITLSVRASRIGREGEVQIGPAVVKIVQKAAGHFNTDYNDDFKVFRDFTEDYYLGDIN